MLKFRRSNTSSQSVDFPSLSRKSQGGHLDRKCSFVSSQLGHSRAAVMLRSVSIPLAWPVEEYFGNKKEWREFTVQLGLRSVGAGGREQSSRPLEKINRTFTDVDFPNEFTFPEQGPDFCIEVTVYCKRTDEAAGGSVVQSLSNSLGRSLGRSWKRYLQQQQQIEAEKGAGEAPNLSFLEQLRRAGQREEQKGEPTGERVAQPWATPMDERMLLNEGQGHNGGGMTPIGIARFRLANATLSGRVHSYTLERVPPDSDGGMAKQNLLPIYGNIAAQILVQPSSLVTPLAQGSMDLFLSDSGLLHQKLRCILQGAQLRCWAERGLGLEQQMMAPAERGNDLSLTKLAAGIPLLSLSIDQQSVGLERTAFPTAFRLAFRNEGIGPDGAQLRHLLCICPSQSALIGWRNAIHLQQLDCAAWADFAKRERNPHAVALGLLPGCGPPPFEPLNDARQEPQKMGEKGKKSSIVPSAEPTLPNPNATIPINNGSGRLPPDNPGLERPRVNSSASMVVRNAIAQLKSTSSLLSAQLDTNQGQDQFAVPRSLHSGASRRTLIDATNSPIPSPTLSRKTNGGQPPPIYPRTALVRRLTQAAKGEKRISWSLGNGPGQRGTTRDLFCPAEPSMSSFGPAINHSAIDPQSAGRMPSSRAVEKVVEEDEREEHQAEDRRSSKSNQSQGPYVISLQIDSVDPIATKQNTTVDSTGRKMTNGTLKGGTGMLDNSTTFGVVPEGKETESIGNQKSRNDWQKWTRAGQLQQSAYQNSSNAKQPISQRTTRPFNINDFSGGREQPAADGRWTRAQLGRAETWHFAKKSENWTRL